MGRFLIMLSAGRSTRHFLATLAVCASISACGIPLDPSASGVRVVTASQKETCKFIRLITTRQSLGRDKSGDALRAALNETAAVGGNAFYMVSSSMHAFDGASVAGEALACA